MTTNSLADRVADAFNRHGKFTASATENKLCVQIRHLDDGRLAADLWTPEAGQSGEWWWDVVQRPTSAVRTLRGTADVSEVVRAVATSVLDEGPKR